MFLIRFVFYFSLSFAILCIPIGGGQHLFDKLYGFVTPYADKAMNTTKQKLSMTKRYSKKLYSNSEPIVKDEIKSKLSSIKKAVKGPGEDFYTEEERERLKKVLSTE